MVTALIQTTKKDRDRDARVAALAALQVLGMFSFPALLALLLDDDPDVRDDACALSDLAKIKPYNRPEGESEEEGRNRARAARSALLAKLNDPAERIRQGAARALGYVGEQVVPELIKALEDRSPLVRLQAVRALGFMDKEASSALGQVRRLLDDSAPEVRNAAAATIKAIIKSDP